MFYTLVDLCSLVSPLNFKTLNLADSSLRYFILAFVDRITSLRFMILIALCQEDSSAHAIRLQGRYSRTGHLKSGC